MNFLNRIRNLCGPCCRETPISYSHDPNTHYDPTLYELLEVNCNSMALMDSFDSLVASPYDDPESKESSVRDSSDNDSATAQHPVAVQAGPIGDAVTTRARVTYGLERPAKVITVNGRIYSLEEWYTSKAAYSPGSRSAADVPAYEGASPIFDDDLDSCSSHGMDDDTEDEPRVELDQVSVSTRARFTYGLEAFEKNAMIIFAQSDEREQQISDRIDMLKSRFGEFRFETDVHVDKSIEEMESTLEEFFSRDFGGVGAVAVVVLTRTGEAGLLELAARAQRCHESALLRWLTDHQPAALSGKPKIYITEANRTGVTADTGCYSLPLSKYRDLDVLGIHIPVLIDGESHPLKILCEQLGSDDFLDAVYTAAHSAEVTFPELKDRPIQVISTLQMQLRLEKKAVSS